MAIGMHWMIERNIEELDVKLSVSKVSKIRGSSMI